MTVSKIALNPSQGGGEGEPNTTPGRTVVLAESKEALALMGLFPARWKKAVTGRSPRPS